MTPVLMPKITCPPLRALFVQSIVREPPKERCRPLREMVDWGINSVSLGQCGGPVKGWIHIKYGLPSCFQLLFCLHLQIVRLRELEGLELSSGSNAGCALGVCVEGGQSEDIFPN